MDLCSCGVKKIISLYALSYKMVSYYYLKQVLKQTRSDIIPPFGYQQFVTVFMFLRIIFNIGTTEHAKLTLKLGKAALLLIRLIAE